MKWCFILPCLLFSTLYAQLENYTFELSQSTSELTIWTTEPSERVFKGAPVPTTTGSTVHVYAARNEFEPFQIVVLPSVNTSINVDVANFGNGITTELYQVKYVTITQPSDGLGQTGSYPDPLWPLENHTAVDVTANQNTAFWFSVFVPAFAPAGDYLSSVTIGGISIPVQLHVFDFTLPDAPSVFSQMNFSHSAVLDKYSVPGTGTEYWMYVDKMKQYFIDHRLTFKSPLWSGGLMSSGGGPYIDYDCSSETLSDPYGIWGFEDPADFYLDGSHLRQSSGFPTFMAGQLFTSNDASQDGRPSSFCGISKNSSDWMSNPSSAYNTKWFAYISEVERYLGATGYLDKAYFYVANEPQDQLDYDAVAWYSQYLSQAAPDIRLLVSEPPKAEIYNHPTYTDAKIDIWLPVLNQYDPAESFARARSPYLEETWIYFLHGTRPPYFNPITLDHPGIESKFTGWFLWKYRIRGIAYYSMNNWSQNPWTDPLNSGHNGDLFMLYPPAEDNNPISYGSNNHRFVPSIRFELMRDSMEDYEYLKILAGGQPQVDVSNDADPQADKIISSTTSYTRDSHFMYNLRRLIGEKNGGEIASIPDIQPPASHPRAEGSPGNYYINFQDPSGSPTDDPLVVNGKEYLKIGWNAYDDNLGYGWFGDLAHVMTTYQSAGPNKLQKSIVYDDWGRTKVFEFDLPAGTYNVTVSVGWPNRTYSHHKIDIEGISFIDDEATIPSAPYMVRTKEVTITDSKLTMDMGIFNEYTMLNYLDIKAVQPSVLLNCKAFLQGAYLGSGQMRTTLKTRGVLPLVSPYGDGQSVPSQNDIPANVVDWVQIQLLTTDSGPVVSQRSFFLQSDGQIVDSFGNLDLEFFNVQSDDYYIAIVYRNHVDIISAEAVFLSGASAVSIDFTTIQSYSNKSIDLGDGKLGLVAGDVDQDGTITSMDYVEWYNTENNASYQYSDDTDLNLDGILDLSDYLLWRQNASEGL